MSNFKLIKNCKNEPKYVEYLKLKIKLLAINFKLSHPPLNHYFLKLIVFTTYINIVS